MHIAIDARMYSSRFTGIGRYVHEISDRIFSLRPHWKITLFLSPSEYENFSPPHKNIYKVKAPEKLYSFREQITLPYKISAVKPDIVWFPHFNVPLLYNGSFIVTIHDLTISKFQGKKKSSLLHKWAYKATMKNALKKSKHIISVSHNTKKDLIEIENTPSEKISVVHNGVTPEFQKYSSQNPPHPFDFLESIEIYRPYFLYTGVWREHKNLLGLIKAFHKFSKHNSDIDLIITGNPDPYYPEINQYIETHHLQNRVKRVGLVNEDMLMTLYSHAKAYVFPSFYEGFGLPPLEAMAMKIPVTCSNTSSLPEVCGESALYFDPYNIEQIEKSLHEIISNQALRADLIQKGEQQSKKFTWEESSQNIIHIIEQHLSV